jgi:hypothetical protein
MTDKEFTTLIDRLGEEIVAANKRKREEESENIQTLYTGIAFGLKLARSIVHYHHASQDIDDYTIDFEE